MGGHFLPLAPHLEGRGAAACLCRTYQRLPLTLTDQWDECTAVTSKLNRAHSPGGALGESGGAHLNCSSFNPHWFMECGGRESYFDPSL
jgi:hypothetical protein